MKSHIEIRPSSYASGLGNGWHYTLLSSPWVHEAAHWGCAGLPEDVAVVMGNRNKFGKLPLMEWGRVTL